MSAEHNADEGIFLTYITPVLNNLIHYFNALWAFYCIYDYLLKIQKCNYLIAVLLKDRLWLCCFTSVLQSLHFKVFLV